MRTLAGFYQKLKDYARALPLYSKLVNMPSGGANDWLGSNGEARAVEGGYIVNAHKRFVSGLMSAATIDPSLLDPIRAHQRRKFGGWA